MLCEQLMEIKQRRCRRPLVLPGHMGSDPDCEVGLCPPGPYDPCAPLHSLSPPAPPGPLCLHTCLFRLCKPAGGRRCMIAASYSEVKPGCRCALGRSRKHLVVEPYELCYSLCLKRVDCVKIRGWQSGGRPLLKTDLTPPCLTSGGRPQLFLFTSRFFFWFVCQSGSVCVALRN